MAFGLNMPTRSPMPMTCSAAATLRTQNLGFGSISASKRLLRAIKSNASLTHDVPQMRRRIRIGTILRCGSIASTI